MTPFVPRILFFVIILSIPWISFGQDPCPDCDLNCILCESLDGYASNNESPNTSTSQGTHCTITEHQISWLGFVAGSTDLSLEVCATMCTSTANLEVLIVQADDCSNAVAVSNCFGAGTAISEGDCGTLVNSTDLIVGHYYWLVFDQAPNENGLCEFTISVNSGITGAPDLTEEPEIDGEMFLCDGEVETFTPDQQDGVTSYEWTLDGDDIGINDDFDFSEDEKGVYQLCATPFNFCSEGPQSCVDVFVGESFDTTYFFEICQEDDCVFFEGDWLCWEGIDTAVEEETWLGCDSIIWVDISYYNYDNEILLSPYEICEGEVLDIEDDPYYGQNDFVIVNGPTQITNPGDYVVTVEDEDYNCEYYIEFEVLVSDSDTLYFDEEICDNETYPFGNDLLNESGMYIDTLTSVNGCDSFRILMLDVFPVVDTAFQRQICLNQTVTIADSTISNTGFYELVTPSKNGCDSLIRLNVIKSDTLKFSFEENICEGASYMFVDTLLATSGTYSKALVSVEGCDSLATVMFNVLEHSSFNIEETICAGEVMEVNGVALDSTDTYQFKLINSVGCDSTIAVDLEVLDSIVTFTAEQRCEGDSIVIGGLSFKDSGDYSITLSGQNGCDSIVNLSLNVLSRLETRIDQEICFGDSLEFNNQVFKTEGVTEFVFPSVQGCDSVVVLSLDILPESKSTESAIVCENEGFEYDGTLIEDAGVFTFVKRDRNNCDSIVTLEIEHLSVDDLILTQSICTGDSLEFFGDYLKAEGNYFGQAKNVNGCDSFVELNLDIVDILITEIYDTFCNLQIIDFAGLQISQSGIYEDQLSSQFGCDSLVLFNAQFKDCSLQYELTVNGVSCHGLNDGGVALNITQFFPPLDLLLLDQNSNVVANEIFDDSNRGVFEAVDLAPGIYTIELEDGFGVMSQTAVFEIEDVDPLSVDEVLSNFSGNNIDCALGNSGQITLMPMGGTAPYQLPIWDDGVEGFNRENLMAGSYTYTLVDDNGCEFVSTIVLSEPDPLVLEVFIDFLDPCDDSSLSIDVIVEGGAAPVEISFLNSSSQTILIEDLVESSMQVMAVDANGCEEVNDYTIPWPNLDGQVDLGPDIETVIGEVVVLEAEYNFIPVDYVWQIVPQPDSFCQNCPIQSFIALEENYWISLTAYDENGCAYTSEQNIFVKTPQRIYVPNVFNPESAQDGFFNLYHNGDIQLIEFKVYTRWGELVFDDPNVETNNRQSGWNGLRNNQKASQGVYVYYIEIVNQDGNIEVFSGTITLL